MSLVSLAELATLEREMLVERWSEFFGCPAPRHAQATLLRGALGWYCQMALESKGSQVAVDRLIARVRRKAAASIPVASLAPGMRLLREWQGQTHHVTVLNPGFEYGGKTYRSLTAITRDITGTAWSGPLFFGLRS